MNILGYEAELNGFRDIYVSKGLNFIYILLTKTTAAQNDVVLTYYRVRGLFFLAVVFVRSIVLRFNDLIGTSIYLLKLS